MPSAAERRALLNQVDRLVLAQTNVFIRELLRSVGKRPGDTKARFRHALEEAIDDGSLTKEVLDRWLRGVEGWGNQHVYAFEVPPAIAGDALWADEERAAVVAGAAFPGTWRAPISHRFPESPEPSRTDLYGDARTFLIEWEERTSSWTREPGKDFRRVEDGDEYRYDAFRAEPGRTLTRFALHWYDPARPPIAALFVRLAVRSAEHIEAVAVAWRDLERLAVGGLPLAAVRYRPWSVSTLIKNLDDRIVAGREPGFRSKRARFSEGLASVEFTSPPDMILPGRIRDVRLAIPARTIRDPEFVGSSGEFYAGEDAGRPTSRVARVELAQPENRIRIWTELDEPDVWALLRTFDDLRS
jgi:hypothetical protein